MFVPADLQLSLLLLLLLLSCRHGQLVMLGSGNSLLLGKVLYVVQSGIVKVGGMTVMCSAG